MTGTCKGLPGQRPGIRVRVVCGCGMGGNRHIGPGLREGTRHKRARGLGQIGGVGGVAGRGQEVPECRQRTERAVMEDHRLRTHHEHAERARGEPESAPAPIRMPPSKPQTQGTPPDTREQRRRLADEHLPLIQQDTLASWDSTHKYLDVKEIIVYFSYIRSNAFMFLSLTKTFWFN